MNKTNTNRSVLGSLHFGEREAVSQMPGMSEGENSMENNKGKRDECG